MLKKKKILAILIYIKISKYNLRLFLAFLYLKIFFMIKKIK